MTLMAGTLEFILNGRPVRVEDCSPNTTLLDFLRARGWTGSKEGCAEGDCGACTVALVERDARGLTCYRAVNSCILLLPMLAGREVVTVEGVADGRQPHPVQTAMVKHHGSQCGYCTPGIVMSLFEGFYRADLKEAWQLADQLCGNLCRCTGYRPIRDAALEALTSKEANGEDPFATRLTHPCLPLRELNYEARGDKFFRPQSLAGLFELQERFPAARLVAGATEVGVDVAKHFKKFPVLISTEAVPELNELACTTGEWRVGAAVTLTRIEEALRGEFPALLKMFRLFASRQIRNRATMGGNLVTASPIGDSAPVLMALDARLVLASRRGERVLPIEEFFVAYRRTALQPGEVLQTILLPRRSAYPTPRCHLNFYKISKREELDISIVAAAFRVELDERGLVHEARLAYGGVAPMPARARKTEAALAGRPWNAETIAALRPVLEGEFAPITDHRGSAEFRRRTVVSLFEKFFAEEDSALDRSPLLLQASAWMTPPPHESGHKHVSGAAIYVDDQMPRRGMLETWPVCSPHAHACIVRRDTAAARSMRGIVAVLTAEDIPGLNDVGAVRHDEILLADKEVFYHGHLVALIVGESPEACRDAAAKVVVEYEPLEPLLNIEQAIASGSFHTEPHIMRRGDFAPAFAAAPLKLEGTFANGGQEHFYLETQAAWAEPGEDGGMFVSSSTQHPSEIQACVAHVLGVPRNKVVVESPRMGGGFGGKETQGNTPAALAALAAWKTGRPARVRFNREQDMVLTGKRHPFWSRFQAGFTPEGKVTAVKAELFANGGWSLDLSQAIADRALIHLDNAYYLPHVEASSRVVKTHLASNTAFRGFGGPQGMLVIEEIMDRVARTLGLPPEVVRERNLYHGRGETNTTHYGQEIEDNRINKIWATLKQTAEFDNRRRARAEWNAAQPHRKRGLAMTPVKFGISFTMTHLNQAGALVHIYQDGSVQVNHGGTEMGQGLHTKILAVTARELGVPREQIVVMPTRTDKVPNTSATAASSGADLNGQAVKNACETLRERLRPVAEKLLTEKTGHAVSPDRIRFEAGKVFSTEATEAFVGFADVVRAAYLQRVSLSSTGFYRTPLIHFDWAAGKGSPFHYFACGAAVTEVEVDGFTGMNRVLRVDILHDVGDSLNEGCDRGQIEGGFVQGMGWLTREELKWDERGRLLTNSASTYQIPAFSDAPAEWRIALLPDAAQHNTIHGSKAVGEPPLMLAISVREALRDAVSAFGDAPGPVTLACPATNEAIFLAIQERLQRRATAPVSAVA